MIVNGIGKCNFQHIEKAWQPFFSSFRQKITGEEKQKIMTGIIEQSSRMIQNALNRQKKMFKQFSTQRK